MVVISDQSQAAQITHPGIHAFVSTRLQQLNAPSAATEAQLPCIATFIVVEPGDCISSIEKTVGFRILESLLDCIPFGHPDYSPPFEIMEEHTYGNTRIYELVFIGNDDGAATTIIVPDEEGITADLLAMCRSFSTPALTSP